MVKLTKAAVLEITNEVKDLINEGKKPLIRLSMGIGWGGPSLHLALVESALENDEIIEESGIRFLVNERDKGYFENSKIDYKKTFYGGGQFILL